MFWTKEISLPHFNRYRMKFRRVWSGKVNTFGRFIGAVRMNSKLKKRVWREIYH